MTLSARRRDRATSRGSRSWPTSSRGRTGAAVDVTSRRRAEYSTDASNYRVVPQAVVFPRTADDIVGTLAVCRDLGVPLTMRGGGTSCAGNAVGPGRRARHDPVPDRVLAVDPEARTAGVQPGVIADDVTAAGAAARPALRPRPSTHARCTIGGMIGNNSCGAHTLAYGRTDANVVDARRPHRRRPPAHRRRRATAHRLPAARHARRSTTLVRTHLATIRTELGRFGRQVSGYALEHLLPENGGNVARALVGSEGTAARRARRHRAAGRVRRPRPRSRCSATRTWRPPPRRCRRCSSTTRWRSRGSTPAWSTWSAARKGAARGAGPAARRRLADGRDGRRDPGGGEGRRRPAGRGRRRGDRRRDGGRRRTAGARRCGGSGRTAPGSPAAPRTTSRRGRAGRTPPSRRSGSAPTSASSTR